MKSAWLALVMVFGASIGPVYAGEWVVVSRTASNAVGIDRSRIRADGATRTFWAVTVQRTTHRDSLNRSFDYDLKQVRIDCRRSTIQTLYTSYYSLTSSSPITTENYPTSASPVVPDTQGTDLEDYVCAQTWREIPFASETADAFARARRTGNLGTDRLWRDGPQ